MAFALLIAPQVFAASGGDAQIQYQNQKKHAAIAHSFKDPMQCIIKAIEEKQYMAKDIGCCADRPNNASAHPTCHACDVDQTGRNKAAINDKIKDPEQQSIAQTCKAVSGCQWRNKDCGHFEAMGKEGYVGAGGGHRYSGYSGHQTKRRK